MEDMQETMAAEAVEKTPELTMAYVLARMEEINRDMTHVYDALRAVEGIVINGPGDMGSCGKAEAIADIVKARETTNQQALRILEKMLDRLLGLI